MGWNMPCPFVPGYDFAGIISSLHPLDENSAATTGLRVGERVCGVNFGAARHDEPGCPVGGAFAEYMAVPLSKLSRLPDELSFSSAAGIGLAGCTAYQMLFDIAKIKAGDRILILGGATSVGMIAIQLAKSAGAWVAATCSARGEDFLRSLALLPDEILPYQATDSQPSPSLKAEDRWDVRDSCKDLHAVLDIVGEAGTFAKVKAAGMVRQGGVFMSLSSFEVGFQPQPHLPAFSWAAKYGYSQSTSQQNEVLALLAKKKIKLPIHTTYPFTTEGVQAMFQQVDGMKSLGKNILSVVDEKEANGTV